MSQEPEADLDKSKLLRKSPTLINISNVVNFETTTRPTAETGRNLSSEEIEDTIIKVEEKPTLLDLSSILASALNRETPNSKQDGCPVVKEERDKYKAMGARPKSAGVIERIPLNVPANDLNGRSPRRCYRSSERLTEDVLGSKEEMFFPHWYRSNSNENMTDFSHIWKNEGKPDGCPVIKEERDEYKTIARPKSAGVVERGMLNVSANDLNGRSPRRILGRTDKLTEDICSSREDFRKSQGYRSESEESISDLSIASKDDSEFEFNVNKKKFLKVPEPLSPGECQLFDLPPIEDLKLTVPKESCLKVGTIGIIKEEFLMVQSLPKAPVLDIGSLLFLDDGLVTLGRIFDVIGQVTEPLYLVRLSTGALTRNLRQGEIVHCAPSSVHSCFIFPSELMKYKGSDASWEYNSEPPPQCIDYSDDEEERKARRAIFSQKSGQTKEDEIRSARRKRLHGNVFLSSGQQGTLKGRYPSKGQRTAEAVVVNSEMPSSSQVSTFVPSNIYPSVNSTYRNFNPFHSHSYSTPPPNVNPHYPHHFYSSPPFPVHYGNPQQMVTPPPSMQNPSTIMRIPPQTLAGHPQSINPPPIHPPCPPAQPVPVVIYQNFHFSSAVPPPFSPLNANLRFRPPPLRPPKFHSPHFPIHPQNRAHRSGNM